jgi:hypothetical protein
MIETDVYAVGLLRDWLHARRTGEYRLRWRWFCRSWRRRSYWNGYLAEHAQCAHNAGRGWTKRAASRRVARICEATG